MIYSPRLEVNVTLHFNSSWESSIKVIGAERVSLAFKNVGNRLVKRSSSPTSHYLNTAQIVKIVIIKMSSCLQT